MKGRKLPKDVNFFKKQISQTILKILVYILLIEFMFVFIFPFLYMFTNSLKSPLHLADMSSKWLVRNPQWDNYREAMDKMFYWRGLKNNLIVVISAALGQILSCSFIAYGLARFKFPGRNLIFGLIIFSLIIPPQVLVIPLYIQYSNLGMLDTFWPIILPTFFGMGLKGGLFIFIFRQFFKSLPRELEEAARIDGCSTFRTYANIVLPLAKSSILVTAILSVVWHWNDSFQPSIYLMVPERSLLSMSLNLLMTNVKNVFQTAGGTIVSPLGMAGAILIILPLFIMYIFLQRKFTQGIERTGLAN
ncbi:carbohydrate ABC transporter permease [Xylanivirga thermophila]|uniref:carbohydrate ABC transporter permease n=1 Tax=Xylanivirga thermophila TaxID=2496273 RepID=UPI00101C8F9E|nr:carbohydrate ABC transporter permease [Xylanivirga thermophila]